MQLNEIKDSRLRRQIQEQWDKEDARKNSQSVAKRVRTLQSESDKRGEGQNSGVVQSQESVRYRVVFVVLRKRLLDDHDNARSALKAIADRITETLGLKSDSDPRISFDYHQVRSTGPIGTHIIIEQIE